MEVKRSLSQVLYSYLPDQTADLASGIWRVEEWSEPRHLAFDDDAIRRELRRAIHAWRVTGNDNDLNSRLELNEDIDVVAVSPKGGVSVGRFPRCFRCSACYRVRRSNEIPCVCGTGRWIQMPFVAYHDCGKLEDPKVPQCRTHKDVKVFLPSSQSLRDLRFVCPICNADLGSFLFLQCECGGGTIKHMLHRAAIVYSPRTMVVVNPPNQEVATRLRSDAAAAQTLAWALEGFEKKDPLEGRPTLDSTVAMFVAAGASEEDARRMAAAAAAAAPGVVEETSALEGIDLQGARRLEAEDAAMKLAYATADGRVRLRDLARVAAPTALARIEQLFKPAVARARLREVELLENFPILTACFGYTRGDAGTGATTLRWFRGDGGRPTLHGQKSETEGMLFRLDPTVVARWLFLRGHLPALPADATAARVAILQHCEIPRPGEVLAVETPGSALLELVHSYAHRSMRKMASFAGIDRDSLSEYLVPLHMSFIIYASSRGDFVLGGLQALFEHDLDKALDDILGGETRCALDPGCSREGGACVACLHVGEPSCRYFNQFLSRDALFGPRGYFTV